jgi:hypothetical protein
VLPGALFRGASDRPAPDAAEASAAACAARDAARDAARPAAAGAAAASSAPSPPKPPPQPPPPPRLQRQELLRARVEKLFTVLTTQHGLPPQEAAAKALELAIKASAADGAGSSTLA